MKKLNKKEYNLMLGHRKSRLFSRVDSTPQVDSTRASAESTLLKSRLYPSGVGSKVLASRSEVLDYTGGVPPQGSSISYKKFDKSINAEEFFCNRTFDKREIKRLIYWFIINYGTARTALMVDKLKTLGFHYATMAGISLSIDDLQIPPIKVRLLKNAENEIRLNEDRFLKGKVTEVERFQKVIDVWNTTSELLKEEVIQNFRQTDLLNPVYMMAFSGARGNISQVRQLVGMRGLMADPQGEIIDLPIKSNFREGLTVTEYVISCYGARKGLVDTALRTANSGYLTRRLVDVAQGVIISQIDCGTFYGINVTTLMDQNKIILSLKQRLIGRVLAKDIFYKKVGSKIEEVPPLAKRNQDICSYVAEKISKVTKQDQEIESIFVRSPLTCEANRYICQLCYGWSLAQNRLVHLGEAVGIIAAQSIGEPGTQLTMRTFHTGGVFAGNVVDRIYAPHDGIISFQKLANASSSATFKSIRTRYGETAFFIEEELELVIVFKEKKTFIKLPKYTIVFVSSGQQVFCKQILAELSSLEEILPSYQKDDGKIATTQVNSDVSGQIYFQNLITVSQSSDESQKNLRKGVLVRGKGEIWVLSGQLTKLGKVLSNQPMLGYRGVPAQGPNKTNLSYLFYQEGDLIVSQKEKKTQESTLEKSRLYPGLARVESRKVLRSGPQDLLLYSVGSNKYSKKINLKNKLKKFSYIYPLAFFTHSAIFYYLSPIVYWVAMDTFLPHPSKVNHALAQEVDKLIFEQLQENNSVGSTLLKSRLYPNGVGSTPRFLSTFTNTKALKNFANPPSGLSTISKLRQEGHKKNLTKNGSNCTSVGILKSFFKTKPPKINFKSSLKRSALIDTCWVFVIKNNGSTLKKLRKLFYQNGSIIPGYTEIIDGIYFHEPIYLKIVPFKLTCSQGQQRNYLVSVRKVVSFCNESLAQQDLANKKSRSSLLAASDKDKMGLLSKLGSSSLQIKILNRDSLRSSLVQDCANLVKINLNKKNISQCLIKIGDLINKGQEILPTIYSPVSGQIIKLGLKQIIVRVGRPYLVSDKTSVAVNNGDLVYKGALLFNLVYRKSKTGDIVQGLPKIEELLEARRTKDLQPIPNNVHEQLKEKFKNYRLSYNQETAARKSLSEIQQFLVDEVQLVYQSQGVDISDKHIEIIVKQMTSKVSVEEGGHTSLLSGEIIELHRIEKINNSVVKGAEYEPIILGITKASLNTESFISAASFQETTRVLTQAAIEGKTDWLNGLKENVILGRLIPAGTGFYAQDRQKLGSVRS